MKKILFFLLAFLSLIVAQAQTKLIVKKRQGTREYEFKEGERIKLKLKPSGEVLHGTWTYGGLDTLFLQGQPVPLRDIRWISIARKETGIYILRKSRDLLILAGAGYFFVSQVNRLNTTGEFSVNNEFSRTSTVLLATGVVCGIVDQILRPRRVAVGERKFSISLVVAPK